MADTSPPLPEPAPADWSKAALPTLQRAFSKNARLWRGLSRLLVFLGLIFVAASTIANAFHIQHAMLRVLTLQVNLATAIAAGFFGLAGVVRLYRIIRDPENSWFDNRTLAERVRSLSWTYAAGGTPFPIAGALPDDTDQRFQQAHDDAANEASVNGIRYAKPRGSAPISVITQWMRATRAQSLDRRRAIYARLRIKNQEDYYVDHERKNAGAARWAQWLLLCIEVVGAGLATLNALAILQLDLVGIAGTVAAGVTAWTQFNQYTQLASTYGAMAYRMAGYRERCLDEQQPWTEERWAAFVGEVEGALREENGTWGHIVQRGATGDP